MRKLLAVVVVLLSIPFFTFGLLFLVAATTGPSRFWVAVVLLAAAAVLLVSGLRWLRRLAQISPGALKTEAVELARRLGGELTTSQLRAEFRIPNELATSVLDKLVAEGSCTREQREERVVYVFKGLLPSMAEKLCPYCGTKLPVRAALRKCPNCGAQLEIVKS
jgi:hypothetical protein